VRIFRSTPNSQDSVIPRSEGSAFRGKKQVLRFAQDDKLLKVLLHCAAPRLSPRVLRDFPGPMEKGCGNGIRTLFYYYYYYINSRGGNPPTFQTLFSYPIHGLSGKIGKMGA